MIDFALTFAHQYPIIFYSIIIIALLLEGPIVIFTLTSLSWVLNLPLWVIFILAIIWDAWGDILHFLVGKYSKKLISKIPFFSKIKIKNQSFLNFYQKIKEYPLLEKLIIIKYTPPLTTPGLLYLWSSELDFYHFLKSTLPLCLISSALVFSIGMCFSGRANLTNHISLILIGLGVCLFILTKGMRRVWKKLVQTIEKKHK